MQAYNQLLRDCSGTAKQSDATVFSHRRDLHEYFPSAKHLQPRARLIPLPTFPLGGRDLSTL